MYDCRYWLWLSTKFEPGTIKCDKLLQAFDYNPKAIYEAERPAYEEVCGSNLRLLNALCDKSLDRVSEILQFCEKNNVGILTQDDPRYPSSLLCIDGQPPVIYYKGVIPDFNNRFSLAIVGTRNVSPYGSSAAYTIAHDIASAGGIIVSGMALGSDTAAHRGALDAKGTTVAFLGCGIDVVYPKENASLMKEIISTGAVMTDYPPSSRPEGRHFPVRNRLLSGVTHGVLVVEAARKSGALITAEHAYKQGKLLYAIPGRIGELNSEGTNNLLIAGAKTVTKSSDILKDTTLFLDPELEKKKKRNDLSEPCETPRYNPYTTNAGGYSDRNTTKPFYDQFAPYPEQKSEKKEEQPTPYKFPSHLKQEIMQKRPSAPASATVNSPKPVVVYKDFDEDENAKSYMSMTVDRQQERERIDMLAKRKILTYPEGPIPPGGYTIELTPEKCERFERMEKGLEFITVTGDPDKITCPIEHIDNLREILRLQEQVKQKQVKKPDLTGLSELEIKVIECLAEKGKITVDSMSHLEIPLPKLLSTLTLLEIKQKVVQLPGGYFELNGKY